jgi:molecular chaperone GrpE
MQDHKKRTKHTDMSTESSVSEPLNTDIIVENPSEGENAPEQAPASASESVNETEKLMNELEASKDKYLRLVAEFENYKRRNAKERMELIQTAGKDVLTSLLPVLDDCDRAEKQLNNSDDIIQIKEGVLLVFNKLRSTLQSKGLRPMDNKEKDFDVEKHEAIAEIQAPDPSLKGKVVDEVEKGYYLNDKLIRFAKVIVGK